MTVYLGDTERRRLRHLGKERRLCCFDIVCNGAGGVTSVTEDDPGCGAADGGANGDLDITFPACPGGIALLSLESAAGTVTYAYFSALALASGTGTVITGKAGVNTDPANGDIIHVEIWGTVVP